MEMMRQRQGHIYFQAPLGDDLGNVNLVGTYMSVSNKYDRINWLRTRYGDDLRNRKAKGRRYARRTR
jgi:hypothetical protein